MITGTLMFDVEVVFKDQAQQDEAVAKIREAIKQIKGTHGVDLVDSSLENAIFKDEDEGDK